jgi:hypothetical protein
MSMEAYCVKCKSKRLMKDEKKVTMKNGKPATQGICTTCGTKMFRIGKWFLKVYDIAIPPCWWGDTI